MTAAIATRPAPSTQRARTAYALNAGLAWLGVVLTVVISALDGYVATIPEPHLYGLHPDGLAGAVSRVSDTVSYFTIWSNVVVAVVMTMLAHRPERDSPRLRVARLDSVLMITITAIVYAVLLAPSIDVEGWSLLTNPLLHIVTPAVTVLVWAIYGPRTWITGRTVVASLAIPVAWVVWMLVRGAVVDSYPYGFTNVATLGFAKVAAVLGVILVFGLVVAAAFWGADRALGRTRRVTPPTPPA